MIIQKIAKILGWWYLNVFFFSLGIQDPSSVKATSTLADLGMDSLMGVDIKQSIERGFGLSLTNTQIQQLKFSELEKVGAKWGRQRTVRFVEFIRLCIKKIIKF